MSPQGAQSHSVWVGILTFGALTAPYLSLFKKRLEEQSFQDFKLVLHDNSEANLGFSAGYNKLLKQAKAAGARYFLVINPDVSLERTALENLVETLERDPAAACAVPKLRRWDFENGQETDIIDSMGLKVLAGLRFVDLGQGEIDRGQYDDASIIGGSGAAVLFRLEALEAVKENEAYFDENFFMYKEDCDLAYRLSLKGFTTRLVSEAVGYHDRTAVGGSLWQRFRNRSGRSRQTNRWGFTNQHFLFFKYWKRQSFIGKIAVIAYAGAMLLNALVFEQYLLSCYSDIFARHKKLVRY